MAETTPSDNVANGSASKENVSNGSVSADKVPAAADKPAAGPTKKRYEDFSFGADIGEGSFSTVCLATDKKTGKEVAVKIVNKARIMKEKKLPHVMREKDVLSKCNSPFVVHLICTFQDPSNLYFCLSLAKRRELFMHIQRVGCMDPQSALFYSAELVLALEYLHGHSIIHRDLKPENILLGWDWHIQLCDFGTAKFITRDEETDGRKSSFVGTAQYVSPELLADKRVTYASDLWALGCIIYQMLAGKTLFHGQAEYAIFQLVVKASYSIPEGFPQTAEDAIRKLVVLDPKERLGCHQLGGFDALKAHPYFEGFDWINVDKRAPPPIHSYAPTLSARSEEDIWSDFYAATQDKEDGLMQELNFSDGAATDAEKPHGRTQAELDEYKQRLAAQKEQHPIWHSFCKTDVIEKTSPVKWHSGFKVSERQLILTDKRLFTVATDDMVKKRDLSVDKYLSCELAKPNVIYIHEGTASHCVEFEDDTVTAEWIETSRQRTGK